MRFEFDDRDPARDAAMAYAAAHPSTQAVHLDPLYVYAREAAPGRQVALLSGGGSGHEPLHGGFVGPGGLDAAVPGRIFASPHSRQIYEAALRVARPGGVLFLVKNYTGDVVNFGIAAERVRAHGIAVEILVIADDVATADTGEMRGTAATVVVEQVLGALADDPAGSGSDGHRGRVRATDHPVDHRDRAEPDGAVPPPQGDLLGGCRDGVIAQTG